jgi:hypothetical protein
MTHGRFVKSHGISYGILASTRCKSTKSSGRRRHRNRNFSVAFKLHVVENAQHHSIRTTARHFGLDRQQVPCYREAVVQYRKMEAQLYDFILDECAAGRCVTGGMILQEALCLLPETGFLASNGWLTRFLRRNFLNKYFKIEIRFFGIFFIIFRLTTPPESLCFKFKVSMSYF